MENVYTQEMHENDVNPEIGSRVIYNLGKYSQCENKEYKLTKVGEEMTVVAIVNNTLACLVSDDFKFSDTVNNGHFKPIDTRTDKEKAIDDLVSELTRTNFDANMNDMDLASIVNIAFDAGLKFTENKND